jgi:AraC family transcriptional regulator
VEKHGCDPVRAPDGAPLLNLPTNWNGLQLGLFVIPGNEQRGAFCTAHPTVLVAQWGSGRRWYRRTGRQFELHTAPGMIEIYPREQEFDQMRWRGEEGQTISIHLTPAALARFTNHHRADDLALAHEVFDERLRWLAEELLTEARRGDGGGDPLYVEGLSLAFLGRLAQRGSATRPVQHADRRLSSQQQRRLVTLIDEELGTELSITRLAGLARMSPDHFAHCFKLTFGQSPYRFVQLRRIEAAHKLLTQTRLPIAEIALAVGFSSQSHFTQVFRQHTGSTPARVRAVRKRDRFSNI